IGLRARSRSRSTKRRIAGFYPGLERLELRLTLCADGADDGDDLTQDAGLSGTTLQSQHGHGSPTYSGSSQEVGTFPPVSAPRPASSGGTAGGPAATAASSTGIPALNSLPGAPATLYLNFGGDTVSSWLGYSNITIPAFDTDGDGAPLSQAEIDQITGIWQ